LKWCLGGRPTPTARQDSGGGPPPQVLRDPGQPRTWPICASRAGCPGRHEAPPTGETTRVRYLRLAPGEDVRDLPEPSEANVTGFPSNSDGANPLARLPPREPAPSALPSLPGWCQLAGWYVARPQSWFRPLVRCSHQSPRGRFSVRKPGSTKPRARLGRASCAFDASPLPNLCL
jgi:hypothetical protein